MEDLIYARQSVDREDSISIESQIDLCLREVGKAPHRVFRDKGYSGKNTERPDFQEMMAAVRNGSAVLFLTSPMLSANCKNTEWSLFLSQSGSTHLPLLEKQC